MGKSEFSVRAILTGQAAKDALVTVRGWVRTRRDSKAGISFIHLSDGTSVAPLQLVAGGELANFETDIKRLGTGCAIIARGKLVASQGKGQSVEMIPTEIVPVG